jgi:hypothetical protein
VTRLTITLFAIISAAAATASADPCKAPDAPKPQGGANERARLEIAPAGKPITHLVIDNPLGNVAVVGYDGTAIQVEAQKHAPDEDTLDRLRVSLVPGADGTVRITSAADGGREVKSVARSAVRVDLVIHAPHGAHVEAAASAGKLDISNLDAGGDLDTASGPISVCNVSGEVYTHSLTGVTRLQGVFGSVDAQSISADVELEAINGERLVATVDKGSIAGRKVHSKNIELTTTDGKIQLEAELALHGVINVASLAGDVDVHLHRHGALVVRARAAKVDFGGLPGSAAVTADGWHQVALGNVDATSAMVELRSQRGNVQFVVVE